MADVGVVACCLIVVGVIADVVVVVVVVACCFSMLCFCLVSSNLVGACLIVFGCLFLNV